MPHDPLRRVTGPALSISIALAGSLLVFADEARADEMASRIAAARELGLSGVAAAEAGDCSTAVDKLSRAEALFHAPTTAEPLGECQVKLGKIIAGTETLSRVAHEQLAPTVSPLWTAAQAKAREALAAALPRVAKLHVHVQRPAGAPAPAVTVDDERLEDVLLDNDRPSDPGTHVVRASAAGCLPSEQLVTLQEGETRQVTLTLEPSAPIAPAPAATSTTPQAQTRKNEETHAVGPRDKTLAYIALGGGALGLVVGSVYGELALGAQKRLNDACTNKLCPPTSQSDVDALHQDAIVSTVAFGVGIVGLAVGGYLFLSSPSPSGSAMTAKARVEVEPWIGPTSLGVAGRFR